MKPLLFDTCKTAAQISPLQCWADRALARGFENWCPDIMELSARSGTASFQNTATASDALAYCCKIPVALLQMRSANTLRAKYSCFGLALNSG